MRMLLHSVRLPENIVRSSGSSGLRRAGSFLTMFALQIAWLLPLMVVARAEDGKAIGGPSHAAVMPGDVRRIVFLGDSITQAGDYLIDIECWLLANGADVEVLNLGLASETASDLTPEENEPHLKRHGFGHPFLSERLDRVMAATKPDWLFACYGMNDCTSLPSDETGTRRFAEAVTHLRKAALAAGVKRVVICTPPVHDGEGTADGNLARYTDWLLSKRADGWDVVDLHTPMRRSLDRRRAKDATFKYAKDGIHPGREGHWLMAREILTQFFAAEPHRILSAKNLFPANGPVIRSLVRDRMKLRFDAWMTQIGHQRPGVVGGSGVLPGPSLAEAEIKAAGITDRIQHELQNQNAPAR